MQQCKLAHKSTGVELSTLKRFRTHENVTEIEGYIIGHEILKQSGWIDIPKSSG